jgi:hypothetical protein
MEALSKRPNESHGGDNLLSVTVVVNGKPYPVTINQNEKVAALIREALKVSGSTGRKDEDYILKFQGQIMVPDHKIKEYNIRDGAELFLSLEAGHGG